MDGYWPEYRHALFSICSLFGICWLCIWLLDSLTSFSHFNLSFSLLLQLLLFLLLFLLPLLCRGKCRHIFLPAHKQRIQSVVFMCCVCVCLSIHAFEIITEYIQYNEESRVKVEEVWDNALLNLSQFENWVLPIFFLFFR